MSTASEYVIHVCEHWVVIAVIPARWTLIAGFGRALATAVNKSEGYL